MSIRVPPALWSTGFLFLACTQPTELELDSELTCADLELHLESCGLLSDQAACRQDPQSAAELLDLGCEELEQVATSASSPLSRHFTALPPALTGTQFGAMTVAMVGPGRATSLLNYGCHCGPDATHLDETNVDDLDGVCQTHDYEYCSISAAYPELDDEDSCLDVEYNWDAIVQLMRVVDIACLDETGTLERRCCVADANAVRGFAASDDQYSSRWFNHRASGSCRRTNFACAGHPDH